MLSSGFNGNPGKHCTMEKFSQSLIHYDILQSNGKCNQQASTRE
uniref:Uncharacterized protein n=1 Tax=Anguilla anguilla TaxID=7936 RepID=A0A0E9VZA1_ANGAN